MVPRDVDAGQIPLALSVLQILALDIGTDLLPPLALGAEPPEPGVLERPPRTRSARSLDGAVLARAVGFPGPVDAVVSLAMVPVGPALLLGHQPGDPVQWVPVLAAPLLWLAAEETREAVARRRHWAVAGPIGLEPPGHETLRRRAAVV